jgi:hypothetical protein
MSNRKINLNLVRISLNKGIWKINGQ